MNNENYTVIQGWMIKELHLSGRELILYSLIYGFSQGDNSGYNGSLKYLMEWLESTKKTVITTLSSLVSKGIITKYEETVNGVKFCRYVANYTGGVKITPGGGVKITPNNKGIDNKNSFQKESVLTNTKEKVSLDPFYVENDDLRDVLKDFEQMRNKMHLPLTDRAKKIILSKLEKFAPADNGKQVMIVERSIERGWKSVYELEEDKKQRKPEIIDDFDYEAAYEEDKRRGLL